MKSYRDSKFKKLYEQLPDNVKALTLSCYNLWRINNLHPLLHYNKFGDIYRTVRIGDHYRAIGKIKNNSVVWFWIGSHEVYSKLLDQMRKK